MEGLTPEAPSHGPFCPFADAGNAMPHIQFGQPVAVVLIDAVGQAVVASEGEIVGNRHTHKAAADILASCHRRQDISVGIAVGHIVKE